MLNLFKRKETKDPDFFNVHHGKFIDKVEEAFECAGTKYYRMKHDANMPYGRYKDVSAVLEEVSLRMTFPVLEAYLEHIERMVDQGKLSEIMKDVIKIRSRMALQFEPETAKKLASIVYFDDTEDLTQFDPEYGKKKVQLWEKHDFMDFFLTSPMSELLGLSGISLYSLKDYISQHQEVIKELTPDMPIQSSPSTDQSKNDK